MLEAKPAILPELNLESVVRNVCSSNHAVTVTADNGDAVKSYLFQSPWSFSKDGTLTIIPISTKNCGIEVKCQIDAAEPSFSATGLECTSYVYGHPVLNISPSDVRKKLGLLSGELRERFVKWNG